MEETYTVPLSRVIDELGLKVAYLPDLPENIAIRCTRVNRPGLQLVGFYDHYEEERIQIIGKVEYLYLEQMEPSARTRSLELFFGSRPVGVVVTPDLSVTEEMLALATRYQVPLLRTGETTSNFMAALIAYLNTSCIDRESYLALCSGRQNDLCIGAENLREPSPGTENYLYLPMCTLNRRS